ncbi:MAG: hypothetical protein JXR83_16875 [Deltaproteobacteria bacterium]|nr:hypothetical protein [Deltaproteobacteria bacterium]
MIAALALSLGLAAAGRARAESPKLLNAQATIVTATKLVDEKGRKFTLKRNEAVTVVYEGDAWYWVKNAKGQQAWIKKESVKLKSRPAAKPARAGTDKTNEPAAAPAPVPSSAAKPVTEADVKFADEPIDTLLGRARTHYDNLDYDQVIPLANAVLARPEPTPDQKLDAYLLQGSALAIVGDSIEAEKSFRLLLHGRPDFDLPAKTPPKILAIFRKVQVEEQAIIEQMKAKQRERIRQGLLLSGDHPEKATGGYPLAFVYRLRDPGNAVEEMRVHYRRHGDVGYSSLVLKRDAEGAWRGAIPGGWTASERDYKLEFYLVTADSDGPLLTVGSDEQPRTVAVAAGTVEQTKPPPLPLWSFLAVSGTAVATAVAAGGTAVGTLLAQQDYRDYAAQGTQRAIDGSVLNQKASTGQALATTTNVLWISSAVIAVAAGVMAPFVNWSGRSAE